MAATADSVRQTVAANMPDCPIRTVEPCGEGIDNVAFDVNGDLIVRFSKAWDAAQRAARVITEGAVLEAVAAAVPVAVPTVVFVDAARGCLAYRKLPGTPLADLPRPFRRAHADAIAGVLGAFLAAVQALPVARMTELVGTDDAPLAEWLTDAATEYRAVADQVPDLARRAVDAFFAADPPASTDRLVFSHNDLGIEHVLVDERTGSVTGVIDWSDTAIVDPAYDLGLVFRDLGPDALAAALQTFGDSDAGLRDRAVFSACCSVFEDLRYGRETGRQAYVGRGVDALAWLFPD